MPEDSILIRTVRCPTTGYLIEESLNVDAGDRIVADFFEIRDVLYHELNVVETGMQARTGGPAPTPFGAWVDLVECALPTGAAGHFIVTETPNAVTGETEIFFALTDLGMLYVGYYNDFTQIRGLITTYVRDDFNGVIENTFEVQYNGPDWRQPTHYPPGDGGGRRRPQPPEYPAISPVYYTGGFNIRKVGDGEDLAGLAGAVFHIATCEWELDDNNNRVGADPIRTGYENATNGRFLATDGNHYYFDDTLPTGVYFVTATSLAEGQVSFNGLPLAPRLVDGFVPPVTDANFELLNRDFYLVETEAPAGFELLQLPRQITVSVRTHLEDYDYFAPVVNFRITELPFTGGLGSAFLVLIAIGIIGASASIYAYDKKRRRR
jgi:hypothetical protein